jgi:hypothetical protein
MLLASYLLSCSISAPSAASTACGRRELLHVHQLTLPARRLQLSELWAPPRRQPEVTERASLEVEECDDVRLRASSRLGCEWSDGAADRRDLTLLASRWGGNCPSSWLHRCPRTCMQIRKFRGWLQSTTPAREEEECADVILYAFGRLRSDWRMRSSVAPQAASGEKGGCGAYDLAALRAFARRPRPERTESFVSSNGPYLPRALAGHSRRDFGRPSPRSRSSGRCRGDFFSFFERVRN